jgi:predicted alpha/beta hydrolase family esterase
MKLALLLHGTGGSGQDYFWFADTKQYLEDHGYQVWWPKLPNTNKPELSETQAFLESNLPDLNEETIIVGHSSACPVILSLLQDVKASVKQVILVAGFYQSIDDDGFSERMIPKSGFDIEAIRAAAKEIIFINSDNDPWGCDDKQARPIAQALSATFILAEGQGHMGSTSFNQNYLEHKLVKDLLNFG